MAQDILNLLKKVTAFQHLPSHQLQWLIDKGQLMEVSEGDTFFKRGDTVEQMFVILSGGVRLSAKQGNQMREIGILEAGEITGLLPYSRMKQASGYGTAISNTLILSIHKDCFTEMISNNHEMVESLVHAMTSRVRNFTRIQQQNDKMMSLGKLSAGLAHELNNPSAAVVRHASELKRYRDLSPDLTAGLVGLNLAENLLSELNVFIRNKAGIRKALSLMERSELEDDIMDWLTEHDMDELETISDSLVDFQVSGHDLDFLFQLIGKDNFMKVMLWLENILVTEQLTDEISSAAKRINELVHSIKSYTHMDMAPEKQMSDVHDGLENTLVILNHKIKKENIELDRNYQENLPLVPLYVSEINQVWTNLLDNAIDALQDVEQKRIIIQTTEEHNKICVRITDTGPGIAEDILDNIFDPFFTTKPVSKGTGMGLDISRKIIEQHQGQLKVESKPGNTTFVVQLPLS